MVLPHTLTRKIEHQLGDIHSLPTLPDAVLKINELVNDENSSMGQIESFVEMDPVLSSTVLRMVNSSFYGMAQEISSLKLALVILGIKEIKNIVLSLSIFRMFSNRELNRKFNIREFWHHSATAGQIAKSLARRLNLRFSGEEFVGGLIHDLGKVVLVKCLPDSYPELHHRARQESTPLWQLEADTYGFHHGHVGGWLGERWHLPRKLITAIVYHEEPEEAPEFHQLVGVVSLAGALSKVAASEDDSRYHEISGDEHPALQLLIEYTTGLDSVDWERFIMELGTDVQRSAEFVSFAQQNLWDTHASF